MKKHAVHKLLLCLPILMSCAPTTFAAETNNDEYTLEQVVVLSRHGLRAPLATGGSALAKVTPKTWPSWHTPGSYLTTRGGVLESYFGHYFTEWLDETNLVKKNQCPTDKDIFVYTNSIQRTIATGQFFSIGAYPGCDIKVNHLPEFNKMDPVFNPIITDGSEEFKQQALAAIAAFPDKDGINGLNKKLKPAYELASNIVDYQDSETCRIDKKCALTEEPTTFNIEVNKEPGVQGPLRTGTIIADALILQHYEGFPAKEVGWGKIKSDKEWKMLVEIKDWFTDVLFTPPVIAKNVAKPLITYMDAVWQNKDSAKFTFLVGHDSNIAAVLSAMDFKDYVLPHQFEKTPIGGKVVFQRWKNNKTQQQLMKIEYVYQSTEQIRQMQVLNSENPPQRVTLEMKGCPTDAQGFCPWDEFANVLNSLAEKKAS